VTTEPTSAEIEAACRVVEPLWDFWTDTEKRMRRAQAVAWFFAWQSVKQGEVK
jgi:hypothetical protein